MKHFPFYNQSDSKDCGPTCLQMVSKYYGKDVCIEDLRGVSETSRNGTNLHFLSIAAEKLGFNSIVVKLSDEEIIKTPLPAILHWDQNHFVVLYQIKFRFGRIYYIIGDPSIGILKLDRASFFKHWATGNENEKSGIALLIEAPLDFDSINYCERNSPNRVTSIFSYLLKYKPYLGQLIIGLILSSLLQLFFPFLTQSLVDVGIRNQDFSFIYIILAAQVFLYLGRISIQMIRNWILLHLSIRVNIAMLSAFFVKLMRLPISFFDSKLTGDLLQRINDHRRIQNFIAISSLDVIFSAVSILVLGLVLAFYNFQIFFVFLVGSALYCFWIVLFLKRRKFIDNKQFKIQSEDSSKIVELINGMQDIKLNGIETIERKSWEQIQVKLYKSNVNLLKITQYQDSGAGVINELKDLMIIVIAAKLVISTEITLGAMLAISYIIGELNTPLSLIINFTRDFQDAQISFNRVSEIHRLDNEEGNQGENYESLLMGDIYLNNVSFRYPGIKKYALDGVNLKIPKNKVTAIIGHSGSGKTTLLKLMLCYYNTYKGKIQIGKRSMHHFSPEWWRSQCGVIFQDSYIFNESIRYNIVLSHKRVNKELFDNAIRISNISCFVDDLALGFKTKIGREYNSLSSGQYQRILIARAVYRNPNYLFFDEATSTLDAENERLITNRLVNFFKKRTVVVIAHRLSTVINADQIIVMNEGKIVERGTHDELISQRSEYYNLVKNQLELNML